MTIVDFTVLCLALLIIQCYKSLSCLRTNKQLSKSYMISFVSLGAGMSFMFFYLTLTNITLENIITLTLFLIFTVWGTMIIENYKIGEI